jgi:alpha-tubulin suppressor-like RCC1 family protein
MLPSHRFMAGLVACLCAAACAQAQPSIATGARHALALTHDGRVLAWGDNRLSQLGHGKTAYAAEAREIPLPARAVAVRASSDGVLLLDAQGDVWSWGTNRRGQLGDGSLADRGTPRIVLRGAAGIVNGGAQGPSFAIDTEGQPWWWGPLPSGTNALVPERAARVPARLTRIEHVASTTVALDEQGTVWSWGQGVACATDAGQHGPVAMAGLPPIADLALDAYAPPRTASRESMAALFDWNRGPPAWESPASTVYAVDRDGNHWRWGDAPTDPNAGRMPVERVRTCPAVRADPLMNPLAQRGRLHPGLALQGVQIAHRLNTGLTSLGLTAEGDLWQWHDVTPEQPLYGRVTLQRAATGVADASAYASGGNHRRQGLLYATRDGKLYGKGANTSGHLASGDAELDASSSPRTVPLPGRAASVYTRPYGSYALLRDGRLFRWGLGAWTYDPFASFDEGIYPQAPVHEAVPARLVKLATSQHRWLALDDEGQVWSSSAWGGEARTLSESHRPVRVAGPVGMPAMRDVVLGGHDHGALLGADGSVWSLAGDPARLERVAGLAGPMRQIAAMGERSFRTTFGLDASGRVWAWGTHARYGATGLLKGQPWGRRIQAPSVLYLPRKAVSIHASDYSLCAVLDDGSAQCLGKLFKEHEGMRFQLHAPIRELSFGVDAVDDPEYQDPRGVEHFGTVHFRLADGTVWAWGRGGHGQLGAGIHAHTGEPLPVVNEAGTADLDLDPATPNVRAPGRPPFRVKARLTGNLRLLSFSAQVFGSPVLPGKQVPGAHRMYALVADGKAPFGQAGPWVALDGQGRWGAQPWPVPRATQQVPSGERRSAPVELLQLVDGTGREGLRIYLGHGRDAHDMLSAGRYRLVLELVPEDP